MAYTITADCIGCRACITICPSHAVTGEKKEIHEINEESCIDCGACSRVCPSDCILDNFGLSTQRIPKKDWERPFFDLDTCMSCNICLDTCPAGALSSNLQKVGSKHLFPFLAQESLCMACGFCVQDCPSDSVSMGPRETLTPPRQKAEAEEA